MRLSSKTLTGVLHAQNKGACDWGYQDKLAFGCQNIVVIVDPKTVQVIQTLDKHKGYVVKVKWAHENYHHDLLSSYNLRLASADFNGRIIVWDVAQASIKAEFSEGSKPIADMEWIKNNDASHDLLAILHPPYSLVLWNADTGTKIWKKSYTEPVQSFSFDPFDVHKIAFLGNDCIVFVDDFTINKVPSSNGKKFYISSPSAQGGSNGNSGNEKSQERRSSKLLGRKVSSILIGESNKKSGEEENVALNECLQLTYHKACRGHLILLYPREILILDLDINQTVGIVPMERAGSPFVQVMTMMQRDALMCLHENGGISLRVRRRSSVSTPSPEQVSTFGTQEDSPINTSSLDVAYDLRCQSDALRITKHNKLYGVMVCPMSEMQVALIMSDSRVLIWQLKSAEYPGHNTDLSSPVYSPGSSPHSDFGFSLSGSGRSGVLPPKTALSSLIGHSAGRMDGSVVPGNRKQFLHKHGLPLKFILIGLLNGVAPPPFVLRMCPPLTTKNWNVYQPLLALGTHTGTIQVYNLSSAAIWREYNIHTCTVRGIEWVSLHSFMSFAYPNPGPSNLVKNEIIITDTLTGKTTHLRANREEESPIETIKISYLKQYFVLVFKDKPFELWDLRSGTLLRQMPKNFPHVTAMEWSPSHSMKSLKKKLTQEAVSPPASSGGMIVSQAESITSSVTSLDPVGRPDTKQLLSSVAAREHFVFTDSDGLLYHFSVEGNVIKEGSKIPPDGGMGSITSIAWKGETMVLGDVDGNLNLWDLKARVSRAVPTHRGWIKKLKFAPGRGNMKLLVLYNDGVDIWDAKEVELVSSIKSPRDITKVTDADWAASDKPVLACADGCVRVMDLKMKLGSAAMEEYQLVEPIFCPHIMEPKASLTLKYVLQHQPWRKSYNLKLDDLGENMAEELVNSVNEQLQILDGEMKEYLPHCQFGTAERCLLTARLFGDESELTFWTVALHYMRTEKVQPMSKSCSRLAMSQTGSSGDLFIPSSTPGSKESTDLVDFGEPSKEKTPHLAHFRDSPLETCFDILCDSQSFQKCQLDRIALHDNKRVTYEHTRRCAENLMLLGQADRAVQLLLETEADNEQYYVDNLRACLVASIRSSGASQSTIKLVATNLIASGKLSEGVQLLCLIDKGLDASRYLQTYGQWYQAAWLAKATLSYPECAEVMKRWADHMSSSLVNQKNRAVLVMLSLGQFMKVVELLYAMRQFDRATLFIEACNEFGLLDKSEETNPLIEAVFLEYARHMISLGNRDATEHYCHLAGEKGKQLQKEIENIFSAVKEKISNTES